MKNLLLTSLLTGSLILSAGELEKISWENTKNWKQEIGMPHLEYSIPKDAPRRLQVKILKSGRKCQLWRIHRRAFLTRNETITCKFKVRADRPGTIQIRAYRSGGDWKMLQIEKINYQIGPEWKEIIWSAKNTMDGKLDLRLPAFHLSGFPVGSIIEFGEMTISSDTSNAKVDKYRNAITVTANDEWRPIDMKNLYIVPGSALDFSDELVAPNAPCGVKGRIISNKHGHLAFEKEPEKAIRLCVNSFTPSERNLNISKKEIEAFAEGIKRQGYNAVRFHGINGYLMSRHRWDKKFYADPATIPFIEKHEDNFHYLLSELKKRGIYVFLDLGVWASGWTTADIWGGGPRAFSYHLIAGTKEYRDNYRAGVLRMLRARNKYTGLTLAEDPTIAVILFYNEANIRFAGMKTKIIDSIFRGRWTEYLKKRYGTLDKLREAWKGTDLPKDVTWETIPCLNAQASQKNNEFACDMARFIAEIEIETTQWFHSIMKEAQYNGLTTQWDFIFRLSEAGPRASTDCVAMHAYRDHPSNFIQLGSKIPQAHSAISMLRMMAPMRMLDRPFLASEYGIVFWNKYRHQQGITCGSFAAHQDWDLLCVHASPVVSKGARILPFSVCNDPVLRASELEAQCLFVRGDVSPARNTIHFPLDDKFIFQGNRPFSAFNGNLSYLSLISKIGVSYGKKRTQIKADLELQPKGGASFYDFGMFGTISDGGDGQNFFDDAVKLMRKKKLLSAENKTDIGKEIYQSDTGEILTDLSYNCTSVDTPRFSGITVDKNLPLPHKVGALTIERAEFPAAISVTTRDGTKKVVDSKKLLLLITTNAVNNKIQFTDNDWKTLVSVGNAPVLYRCGKFAVRIRSTIQNPVVYALNMNGSRSEKLPAIYKDGEIHFSVDVRKIKNPTPFFEISEM